MSLVATGSAKVNVAGLEATFVVVASPTLRH